MFAGVYSTHSHLPAVNTDVIKQSLAPYHQPDNDGFYTEPNFWLYEQRHHHGYFDHDPHLPLYCEQKGVVVAFWGRLDNREQLAATLGLNHKDEQLTDAQLVLEAWSHFLQQLPEQLLGDFAIAIVDKTRQQLFLVRDPLGVKPLYYSWQQDKLFFASSAAALKAMDGIVLSKSTEWMARYLWLGLSKDPIKTAYNEMRKLPPAHCLLLAHNAEPQLRRWHFWRDDAPIANQRDERWVNDYRAVLEESIRCRMHSPYPLGTENSGGIDSATLTAYLAKFLDNPVEQLHSFGFAMCEQEPEYILETSQACGIAHNYLVSAQLGNQTERMERTLKVLGYPEEHGNASFHLPFYQQCQQRNIKVLFSGFGGDEVVTNPANLARYEFLDNHQYGALFNILSGNAITRPLRLVKAILKPQNPAYRPTFLTAWRQRWPYCLLKKEVIEAYNIQHDYMESARYDAPFRRVNDFILQHHLHELHVTTRLDNCTLMANSFGIDYRWPLWDVRLVQQYLSTPTIEKIGPKGIGRYLHRRAITGTVPHKVAWKPSKDMGYGAQHVKRQQAAIAKPPVLMDLPPNIQDLLDPFKFAQWQHWSTQNASEANVTVLDRVSIEKNSQALTWLTKW